MLNKEILLDSTTIGLSELDFAKIKDVFASVSNLEQVWLYGSRAKGGFDTYSDIDITLKGNYLTIEIQYRIMQDLDDLYLPYIFDISIFEQIKNQDLLAHIERVGELIYEKKSEVVDSRHSL